MTNIEKLRKIGILGEVRQRFGAGDENDETRDERINTLDNDGLVKAWAGWHFGDGSWWAIMKGYFDKLELFDKTES